MECCIEHRLGRPPTFFLLSLFLPQRGGFGRGCAQRQAAVAAPDSEADTHETSLVCVGLCETDRQRETLEKVVVPECCRSVCTFAFAWHHCE